MNILDLLTNEAVKQLGLNGDGAQRLVANIMLQRSELMKSLLDSPRDVDADCGYPSGYISTGLYKSLYDREPVPARVVEVYPKECFQVQPTVFEDESADVVTPFEEAWDALGKQLRGEQSFYQEEESSAIWTYLYDADVKSGIGHYAGILLGIDDGVPLNEPAEMITPTDGNGKQKASSDSASRRLLFMRVFGESDMRINSLETDMSSPRYGCPVEYDISLIDPTEFTSLGLGASLPTNRAVVHWSRVVHISEYGVLHIPRMQPVLNRLLDLRKLQGGSAEMYWRGAFPGYAIKTQPQLGADVDINREDVKQQLTDYSNALQRFLVLMGMDITALAPQVSDPSSQVGIQLDAICIQLGIPKRIFMGSERGELASSQDDQAWNDRLKQRQLGVITPRIIIPVVDRLISLRVLPRPAKGYRVSWPDLTSKSDEEKAGIATQRTQAVSVYVAGQLETTLAPMDFWTRIMGFTEDEAQSIIDNAEEIKQQKEKEQAAKDAEAARVQAEAQAKIDETAKTAADATGSEQTATAPGSPTSPGKPFGGKGSQSPTPAPPNGSTGQPGGSTVGGVGSTPVAHQDFTLVADFDPSQARDTNGRWSPSGKANAFDHVLEHGGTEKNQTVRDFYKAVHKDVSTTRPAGDHRFHNPLRLHIEQQLHELAGDHGEALYRTGAAGMTQIAFKKHEVNVVTDAPGQVTIFSEHLHGPDPRDPTTFTITHATPHEEVAYRLRKAAGLKVDKAAAEKYMAEDKKARDEFRAQRKAALEAQKTAREARRAEKEARRTSTQNVDIPAEEISQLVNSSGLDINAVGDILDANTTSNILGDELLDRILENLDLASNAVTGPNPWAPYVGKRGGRGWKNGITGRVAYQLNQPGLGRRAAVTPVGAPAAATPGQPRAQRADPTDVKNHITKLLSDPSKITAADIHKVREDLLSMTVAQIHGVRKDLGLKASGLKKDLADKVASRALAGLGKSNQPQTTPTPPQPQSPAPVQHPTPAATPAQHPPSHVDAKDPVAVRAAVHAFIASKNWSGGAAGILQAYAHGSDTPLEKLGAHLASLTGVPHHVGFSLAHTAVKELAAGLPTHSPAATPAQPAAAGSPSPLHRGANVITGTPAQAPMALPVVPHKDEIQWSTGKPEPGTLHGVDFASAPHHFWEHVKDKDIGEPKPTRPIDRAGVMIVEPDGRIWIVRPTNEFGDRKHTLPGGGVETGLTHQQNALKEVWEETGLQVEITGHLGDFRDSNNGNNGRLYIGRRIGGAPWDAKIEPHIIDRKTGKPSAESSEVLLVTPERAGKLLHRSDDLAQLMTVAPIPLGTPTRGRGSEPLKKLLEAVQPAAKAYKDARQAVNAVPGNAELHAIQDMRGFNAKPTVVSKNDMDALVAGGGHIEVLRGLSANAKPNVSARRVVDTLAEQFRTGDHYPGYGIFGSGTYTDSTKGYSNIASQYASGQRGGGGGSAGATLRMAIPKGAKIVKFSDLEAQVPHAPPDFTDHGPSSYSPHPDWRGVHAALAGYDAIHMDKFGYGHDFYVILNRGVVTVQKEDATGHIIR